MVRHSLSDEQESRLEFLSNHPMLRFRYGPKLDKNFYYANLTYNFTPNFYAYAGYSYIDDKLSRFWMDGLTSITGGIGYRPIDEVALKAQFSRSEGGSDLLNVWYKASNFYVAASVFF